MKKITGNTVEWYQRIKSPLRSIGWLVFLGLVLMQTFIGCAALNMITGKPVVKKLGPPVADIDEQLLEPGLSVIYFHGFYRNLAQMPRGKNAIEKGIPGKPILYLDHQFGEDIVFDSGRSKGVGMQMDGFIRFETPGKYIFQARTNDGFRFAIDGRTIIEDPSVHSDRMSQRTIVEVTKPGWYPVQVLYFQRKGTATIQLFWQAPENDQQVPVPAQAYAHLPEK